MTKRSEHTGGHAASRKSKLHKITLYVRPDQVVTLEEIQLSERRRTGRKPDKSGLLQDAIDLLIERYRAAGHPLG
jgi:hypothetical protein